MVYLMYSQIFKRESNMMCGLTYESALILFGLRFPYFSIPEYHIYAHDSSEHSQSDIGYALDIPASFFETQECFTTFPQDH